MNNEILEKWLPIKEWEDIYEVSDLGRVRRLPFYGVTKSGKKHFYKGLILKQEITIFLIISYFYSKYSHFINLILLFQNQLFYLPTYYLILVH